MNKYWFRKRQGLNSKDYGWGWVPITWEGWMLILAMVGSIFLAAFILLGDSIMTDIDPPLITVFAFLAAVLALIAITAFIAHKKSRP